MSLEAVFQELAQHKGEFEIHENGDIRHQTARVCRGRGMPCCPLAFLTQLKHPDQIVLNSSFRMFETFLGLTHDERADFIGAADRPSSPYRLRLLETLGLN